MSTKNNIEFNLTTNGIAIRLRAADVADLQNLRLWKNANREYFFHKEEISTVQQDAWFGSYQTRSLDFMFVVCANEKAVGCMGIRLLESSWDVYNVILGEGEHGKRGIMGAAFQQMLAFAQTLKPSPITLKVLQKNPAVGWYQKQGFSITSESDDYCEMTYQP